MTFTLELVKPELNFNTPTGATTLLPLSSAWVGHNATFQVDDNSDFDLGSQMPDVTTMEGVERYGNDPYYYTRGDRTIQFTVYIQATTPVDLKNAVNALHTALTEVTQYNTSAYKLNGLGKTLGYPLMLKYQPHESLDPVYFNIKFGYADLKEYNDNVKLLSNVAYIPVTLRTSYAAYGKAMYLSNLIKNGTFSYGFKGWTGTTNYTPTRGATPTTAGWQIMLYVADNFMSAPYFGSTTMNGVYADGSAIENGLNSPYWSHTTAVDPVFSSAAYVSPGTTGTNVLTSSIIVADGAGTISSAFSTNPRIWLGCEFKGNAAAGILSLQLQTRLNNGSWVNFGSAITSPAAPSSWTPVKWSVPDSSFSASVGQEIRLVVTADNTKTAGTYCQIRKIALWFWPGDLDSNFWATYPTEYVSQPTNITDECVLTGTQGNLETNARISFNTPRSDNTSLTIVNMQQLNMGARKQTDEPLPSFPVYSTLATTINSGNNYSAGTLIATNQTQRIDMKARQYKVILRIATTDVIGMGIGHPYPGASASTYNGPMLYTVVPNASLNQIPNTGNVHQYVDAGTVTLPPYNASSIDTGATMYQMAINFTRLSTSGAGTININLDKIWLLPADQMVYVDTRAQGLVSWTNYMNYWTQMMPLVHDSLFKESAQTYLTIMGENSAAASPITPVATTSPIRLYPATVFSPEPMVFAATERRTGSAGLPAADITGTDPLYYTFVYCPAYEF